MSDRRRLYLWGLRGAIVAALVAVVVVKGDVGQVVANLGGHSIRALLLGMPLILLSIVAAAWRYAALVRWPGAPLWLSIKGYCLAMGLDVVLPARLSEFLKVIYLRDKAGIPAAAGIAALFSERVADVLMAALLMLWAVMGVREQVDTRFLWLMVGIATVVIVVFPRVESLVQGLVRLAPIGVAKGMISRLVASVAGQMRSGRFFFAFSLGAVSWGLSSTLFWVLIDQGGAHPVGLTGAIWVLVVTSVGRAIPALPAGLGTYEAAAVYALSRFGYSFEEALAVTIILRIGTFGPPFAIAVAVVATEKVGVVSLAGRIRELLAAQRVAPTAQ